MGPIVISLSPSLSSWVHVAWESIYFAHIFAIFEFDRQRVTGTRVYEPFTLISISFPCDFADKEEKVSSIISSPYLLLGAHLPYVISLYVLVEGSLGF